MASARTVEKSSGHLHRSLVQTQPEPEPESMAYYGKSISNFRSLRRALKSLGLKPKFIELKKAPYACCPYTMVMMITLEHDHLPYFYRQLLKGAEMEVDVIYAVARTKLKGTTTKYVEFPLANDQRPGLYWLDEKRCALHLNIKTGVWSVGSGRYPTFTSEM